MRGNRHPGKNNMLFSPDVTTSAWHGTLGLMRHAPIFELQHLRPRGIQAAQGICVLSSNCAPL
eukprot:1157258-Pelagomonas_calceolata.AAC.8